MEGQIVQWLDGIFSQPDFEDCILIELVVSPTQKIEVFIDSDSGMTFEKCRRISRLLEGHLDETQVAGEKYTLEVSSPGAHRPMKFLRQYVKHIGRNLNITLTDDRKTKGKLLEVGDNDILIEHVIKNKKKKKEKIQERIPFESIEEALVALKF